MAKPEGELFAITANDLRDGLVVYLDKDGGWTGEIGAARMVVADGVDAALADAGRATASGRVVGAYEIAVARTEEGIRPLRLRERIRAFGPSTHADFRRADVAGHLDHADGVVAVSFGR
jgi:hypothetical protein